MELFRQGYNCSQSIVMTFAEEVGLDPAAAVRIASSFGGGMGRLREVCGAVSGMFMIAGYKFGYGDPKDFEAKKRHYALIQELAGRFREKNGSIVCRELLTKGSGSGSSDPTPTERTEEYYKKRPCPELIGDAAEILAEYIALRERDGDPAQEG